MTIMTPAEVLERDGVVLRRWRPGDAGVVYRAVTQSLAHLAPWMPWAAGGYAPADAEDYLRRGVREWDAGENFDYAIVAPDGAVVGSCGIMTRPRGGVEIGYWLHVDYTGQGIATRAAAALTAESFRAGAAFVQVMHDGANWRSGAVPARLGFREVYRGAVTGGGRLRHSSVEVRWQLDRPAGSEV